MELFANTVNGKQQTKYKTSNQWSTSSTGVFGRIGVLPSQTFVMESSFFTKIINSFNRSSRPEELAVALAVWMSFLSKNEYDFHYEII